MKKVMNWFRHLAGVLALALCGGAFVACGDTTIYDFTTGVGTTTGATGDFAPAAFTANTSFKFGKDSQYVTITPANGEVFRDGDSVSITGFVGSDGKDMGLYFCTETSRNTGETHVSSSNPGKNNSVSASGTLVLTSDASALYLFRYASTGTTITSVTIKRSDSSAVSKPTITITPNGSVTLACATEGATIYYTVDGSDPTTSSSQWSSSFTVEPGTVVKAMGAKSGSSNSDVATSTYSPKVATPTISPASGAVDMPCSVSLACSTDGATIHYTTDGTTPTAASPTYEIGFSVDSICVVRAIAVKENWTASDVASAKYTDASESIGTVTYDFNSGVGTTANVSAGTFDDKVSFKLSGSAQYVTITPASGQSFKDGDLVAITGRVGTAGLDMGVYLSTTYESVDKSNPVFFPSAAQSGTDYGTVGKLHLNSPADTLYVFRYAGSGNTTIKSLTIGTSGAPVTEVKTPTISPAAGEYTMPMNVTISCATDGATIRYTTDGTEPTTASTEYSEPFSIESACTVKARAYYGEFYSDIAAATYTWDGKALLYDFNTNVGSTDLATGSVTTSVAQTSFTFNGGSEYVVIRPSSSHGKFPTNITVSITGKNISSSTKAMGISLKTEASADASGTTVRQEAPATKNQEYSLTENVSFESSPEVLYVYRGDATKTTISQLTIKGSKVAMPVITRAGNNVTLSCATAGATIKYRYTDGGLISQGWTDYSGTFTAESSYTVYAYAVKENWEDSETASNPETVATPTISPAGGTYDFNETSVDVTITCGTVGATIYYTTDGYDPTTASTQYSGSFSIGSACTVKAIAVKEGMIDSSIISAIFSKEEQEDPETVSTPTISPAGGACSFPKTVSIGCGTDGATVYYTTDGSDPADSTTKHSYTASFSIDGPCTVKAYAVKSGWNDSSVATVAYTDATVGEGVTAHVVNGVCTISGSGAITDTSTLKGLGVTNLVISSGVTGIGDYAFKYWTSLRNVTVAETCINVGVESFHKCANVTNMSFAAPSITVKDYAFLRCPSLQKLSFSSMPTFGTSSFAFSTAIFMTNGVPELYTIPAIEITGYAQVLKGSNDLTNWETVDPNSEEDRKKYKFFKIVFEDGASSSG